MKKVFISYVRSNSEAVDRICDELRKNAIEYWIDREQIKPGTLWKTAIKEAINDGAYFLACFSREYEERTETHMNEEIILAVEILRKKHFNSGWFIPVKLSDCNIPSYNIGAGSTLQDIHYLEFHKDWERGINRLIDMIKRDENLKQDDIYEKFFEKQYIYQGLKSLIEKGDGIGFHNADQGHPVYQSGAKGRLDEMWEYADSSDKNLLFQMLSKLTKELKELEIENYRFIWWYDFSEWKDFCKFAVDVYNKKRGYT
ncbi:MAG: toll/interleukin-1 receptor domain-containing protein [Nitrospirae bacterium]|nr:toll/interleukin-1 receptor domain-containing protein [Nitrospirota bacterium]